MIYIVTGENQTGKTTNLFRWLKGKEGILGILAPTLINKKQLYSILSDSTKQLEDNQDVVYEWGKQEIEKAIQSETITTMIVDGISELELEGKGFEPIITQLISQQQEQKFTNLILVLPQNILLQAIEYFQLDNHKCKMGMP